MTKQALIVGFKRKKKKKIMQWERFALVVGYDDFGQLLFHHFIYTRQLQEIFRQMPN